MSCALGQQKDKPSWAWGKYMPIYVWGMLGIKKNLESKNSSEDQSFYVAVKPECNSNKGQYAQEKLARRPSL
jgi:hypothetical protein